MSDMICLFQETDMTNICLVMKCLRADGECIPYAAARGTACKGPDTEKVGVSVVDQC